MSRLKWWWQMLIVVISLGAAVTTTVLNPRFSLITGTDMYDLDLKEATTMNEPRLFIWHTVLSHADEYPFFGLGAGCHRPFLEKQYETSGNELYIHMNYGTHCQYFSYWMCLGPLAVLLLIAAFFCIPRVYKGTAHYSAHALAFLFLFHMISDDLLERMDSILILLVWMILLHVLETTPSPVRSTLSE